MHVPEEPAFAPRAGVSGGVVAAGDCVADQAGHARSATGPNAAGRAARVVAGAHDAGNPVGSG
ncbi:hypothetical protein [Pseudoxanthomonas sacheonensis]|uniref:hypothetical protein n=1 Tax=Pseudoxanthomonas sacheonensis TaxID=443615 RepID=UPI001BA7BE7F|nr:hypothetical protein [Pseudoxanthomonas sacheonensis]